MYSGAKKPGFTIQQVGHRGPKPGPETNPWYWNPNRVGAYQAPSWFMKLLHEVEEKLDCRFNPVTGRWQVWYQAPRIQTPICSGWNLILAFDPWEMDERVMAVLYDRSQKKWGSAEKYFDRVVSEIERDREKKDRASRQEAIDMAMPSFEHSQIKNIGKGSKFATYHS